MSREKSNSLVCRIIDFVFGSNDSEDEAALEKSAAIIYEVMNFIFLHKDSGISLYEQKFFCSSLTKELFSCPEAIRFGVEQGWIEETENKIKITEYGFGYEKEFWKTFR